MNKLFFLFLFFLCSLAHASIEKYEKDFASVSNKYVVDFNLLKSIALAESGGMPLTVLIAGERFNFTNVAEVMKFVSAIRSKSWLLVVRRGGVFNLRLFFKNKRDAEEYITSYMNQNQFTLLNINFSNVKYGIMGIKTSQNVEFNEKIFNPFKNISYGAKKLKDDIKLMGLKNALKVFCECKDYEDYYRRVGYFYNNLTDKNISTLFSE